MNGSNGWYRSPSPIAAAFRAGWLVSQLHGPLLEGPVRATARLPTTRELSRAERVALATAELHDLIRGPLGRVLDRDPGINGGPDAGPLGTADLDAAAVADDGRELRAAVEGLHPELLIRLAVADGRLGDAYCTGLTLSDACWVPATYAEFRAQFQRNRLGTIKGWLGNISAGLPTDASAVVSQSIDHWAAWVGVHRTINRPEDGAAVLRAARAQGEHWRALLSGDKDPASLLCPEAYIQAGERAISRSRTVVGKIAVHFWPLVLLVAAVVGGSVFLAIHYAHGTAKVWASLLSLATGLGLTTTGLKQGASRLAQQAETPLMNLANVDAMGWACTWLPTVDDSRRNRRALRRRGVAPPSRTLLVGPPGRGRSGRAQVQDHPGSAHRGEGRHLAPAWQGPPPPPNPAERPVDPPIAPPAPIDLTEASGSSGRPSDIVAAAPGDS